jgi:LysM repeat protein
MNHDDDLERLISGSLASRSDGIGGTGHSLDDVHRRVELRRGRRRHVAAFGATAMLAAGAFALTAIGSSDPTTVPLATPDGSYEAQPGDQPVWRCTGPLAPTDDQGVSYFASCEQVTLDGAVPVDGPTATSVPLYPTTTIFCPVVPTTETAVSTVPCAWGPPPTIGTDCSTMSRPAEVTVPCGTSPVQEVTYRVEAGDTLSSISEAYSIPIEEIVALNPWGGQSDVTLVEGETIVIALAPISPTVPTEPVPATTMIFDERFSGEQEYTIQPGDSLVSIAQLYGITLEQLVNYNMFVDGAERVLIPGERLLVPPNALAMNGTPPGGAPVMTTTSIP